MSHHYLQHLNVFARHKWWSLSPAMTDEDVHQILYAIKEVSIHHTEWIKDYVYLSKKNEFIHKNHQEHSIEDDIMSDWFSL